MKEIIGRGIPLTLLLIGKIKHNLNYVPKQRDIVEQIVKQVSLIDPIKLLIVDQKGSTPLHMAAHYKETKSFNYIWQAVAPLYNPKSFLMQPDNDNLTVFAHAYLPTYEILTLTPFENYSKNDTMFHSLLLEVKHAANLTKSDCNTIKSEINRLVVPSYHTYSNWNGNGTWHGHPNGNYYPNWESDLHQNWNETLYPNWNSNWHQNCNRGYHGNMNHWQNYTNFFQERSLKLTSTLD